MTMVCGYCGSQIEIEGEVCHQPGCLAPVPYGDEDEPEAEVVGQPEPTLARRLGWMANAIVHAKTGPSGRFFTRERADEIALLLREAEKRVLEGK